MKKFYNTRLLLLLCLVLSFGIITSCDDDDDIDPSGGQVQLLSFGPSGVQHGDAIRFFGRNLDRVEAIEMVGATVQRADFLEQTTELIRIIVPEEAMEGRVTLRLANGEEVVSQTVLSFNVPITITSVTEEARPGANITITGTRLNWVEGVVFGRDTVDEFVSQSASQLVLQVPMNARTGTLFLLGGGTEPMSVETEQELIVTLPQATALAPASLRTGQNVTITGTNLDLVQAVMFTGVGEARVEEFASQTPTQIEVQVPANAASGPLTLVALSDVEVETTQELTVVLPAVTALSPNAVRHGANLTITGTNLDLVEEIQFTGVGEANVSEFESQSATRIVVTVPDNASTGPLTLVASSGVEAETTQEVNIVLPVITSLSPSPVNPGQNLTINGTNLDLVDTIRFEGGTRVSSFINQSANRITVRVPMDARRGTLTLVTTSNYVVETEEEVNIILPAITRLSPEPVAHGSYLTITGTELNQVESVVFTGGATVSDFVAQNENQIVLRVPADAEPGELTFITNTGFEVATGVQAEVGAGLPELATVLFQDARATNWEDWGWGGPSVWNTTEQVRQGEVAAKKTYNGSNDAIRMHNNTAVSADDYTHLVFTAYGGSGTDGKTINVVLNEDYDEAYQFPVVEGRWTTYRIPLSELGDPATINDVLFQSAAWSGVVYYDHIGFE